MLRKYAAESMRTAGRPTSPSGRRTRKVYLMPLGTGAAPASETRTVWVRWEAVANGLKRRA